MLLHWLPLTLLCALALASADAATKAWLQEFSARELAVVRLGLTGLLLSPLLWDLPPLTGLPAAFWWWLAALVPLELLAMLFYMKSIRDHPLSLTLPYLAFTPVFVMGIAWVLLGEAVTLQGAGGVFLVVAGAWLLNGERAQAQDWRSWGEPFRAVVEQPGSRMMLATAAIFALTSTMGKGAMQYMAPEQFGPFYFGVLGLTVTLVFAVPRPGMFRKLARRPWAVLTVAALMGIMAYTHFLAIAQVEVAYMIAVKRVSLLFGILYGALLFRETGLIRRLPAGALMVAGVALILL
ncbi:EamA family transporter [Lamprocystis purpurea]|jgi:drug/metabolite transporter (DMT)-like permease|uniref:EamA family transporter n=1 Tax=Lamprocystis purpurea TaxID=61598 RepID=UPI00037DB113|nr:DMT family transporter [Lamprocystis purpurea]